MKLSYKVLGVVSAIVVVGLYFKSKTYTSDKKLYKVDVNQTPNISPTPLTKVQSSELPGGSVGVFPYKTVAALSNDASLSDKLIDEVSHGWVNKNFDQTQENSRFEKISQISQVTKTANNEIRTHIADRIALVLEKLPDLTGYESRQKKSIHGDIVDLFHIAYSMNAQKLESLSQANKILEYAKMTYNLDSMVF